MQGTRIRPTRGRDGFQNLLPVQAVVPGYEGRYLVINRQLSVRSSNNAFWIYHVVPWCYHGVRGAYS